MIPISKRRPNASRGVHLVGSKNGGCKMCESHPGVVVHGVHAVHAVVGQRAHHVQQRRRGVAAQVEIESKR
jgi:hypothetical protein